MLRSVLRSGRVLDWSDRLLRYSSLTNDLDQHALAAGCRRTRRRRVCSQGPKIELAFGDCHHHFATHDLPLEVSIGVVFAGAVVAVAEVGRVRGELLKPHLVVVMQA